MICFQQRVVRPRRHIWLDPIKQEGKESNTHLQFHSLAMLINPNLPISTNDQLNQFMDSRWQSFQIRCFIYILSSSYHSYSSVQSQAERRSMRTLRINCNCWEKETYYCSNAFRNSSEVSSECREAWNLFHIMRFWGDSKSKKTAGQLIR